MNTLSNTYYDFITSMSLGPGEKRNKPVTIDLSFGVMDLNSWVVIIIEMLACGIICLRLKKRLVIIEPFARCLSVATQSSSTKRKLNIRPVAVRVF